jgi:hypothetical protein
MLRSRGSSRPARAGTAPSGLRRVAAVVLLVFVLVAGLSAGAAAGGGGLESRLAARGYGVHGDVSTGGLVPAPRVAFTVSDVDWVTPHSFSVAVYVFERVSSAAAFAEGLKAKFAPLALAFPRSFPAQHRVRVVGSHVYVAFTEMDQESCVYLGVCTGYLYYGVPHCGFVGAGLTCSSPVAVPVGDFTRLVSVAEGR